MTYRDDRQAHELALLAVEIERDLERRRAASARRRTVALFTILPAATIAVICVLGYEVLDALGRAIAAIYR